MAWTYDQVELHHLNLTATDAHVYQRLAARLLYADATLRPGSDVLARNTQGQPGLWAFGISGDLPIVLAHVAEPEEFDLVRELLLAHAYWRMNGLTADLVILNEYRGGYLQALHEQLQTLVVAGPTQSQLGGRGGVFLLRADVMSEEDRVLLQTVARAVLLGSRGV
jgi:cellobiose phosphorylase